MHSNHRHFGLLAASLALTGFAGNARHDNGVSLVLREGQLPRWWTADERASRRLLRHTLWNHDFGRRARWRNRVPAAFRCRNGQMETQYALWILRETAVPRWNRPRRQIDRRYER